MWWKYTIILTNKAFLTNPGSLLKHLIRDHRSIDVHKIWAHPRITALFEYYYFPGILKVNKLLKFFLTSKFFCEKCLLDNYHEHIFSII